MGEGTGVFRRSDRLRRSWEFRRVSRLGRRSASGNLVVLVAPTPEGARGPRLGLTVSRRVGGAVVRNRVKRGVREWFRRERGRLPLDVDVVVIARPAAARRRGNELGRELQALTAGVGEQRV